MTTLLVANRGEVVSRVFRTARGRLGMRCVAVYSEADAAAPFVNEADLAIPIGPAPATDSYLRIDRVLDAAKTSAADLIHPGYGFLAEDAEFAEACERAGIGFVGPQASVLRAMGAKDQARKMAEEAGVPVTPGYSGPDQSDDAFARAADEVGYPVIVKPAEGGGGKGMAVARGPDELLSALASARRVGAGAFGDDRLLLERYIEGARHVEVQILGDTHGHLVHLYERDCSLQRRHQKIFEESPAPNLPAEVKELLLDSALRLGRHVGYQNAGTCEFVVGRDGAVSFLEINARLQVEHPVTEVVCNVDLVELQLRIAMGEPLPFDQDSVAQSRHAMEVRVYAEDPSQDFLPQAGKILYLKWPDDDDVRIDAGVVEGSEVSTYYDPMLAKIICSGPNRDDALTKLEEALAESEILGVRTNLPLLRRLVDDPDLRAGVITTGWLESSPHLVSSGGESLPREVTSLAAAAETARRIDPGDSRDPWRTLGLWRQRERDRSEVILIEGDAEVAVYVAGRGPFTANGLVVSRPEDASSDNEWLVGGEPATAVFDNGTALIWWNGDQWEVPIGPRPRRVDDTDTAHLDAPMPGQVISVSVAAGDGVSKGQSLLVVEAMKMEHVIRAPADGTVRAVLCAAGDQVDRGQKLVDFEPA